MTHVNGEPVQGLMHTQVLQLLMSGGEAVTLRATALETTSIKTGGRRRDPQAIKMAKRGGAGGKSKAKQGHHRRSHHHGDKSRKTSLFRKLSSKKATAEMQQLAAAQGALHHLDLGGHNMTLVPAELLVEAISRLESVMLSSRSLTMDQLIVLYQMVAERRSVALRELVVSRNVHCAVPSDILATALIRLVKVDLFYCNLSAEQLQVLFSKIATNAETSTLRYLDVSFSKASLVPVEVLTGALVTLEAVMLQGCCLTLDQLEALYSMVAERRSGRLVELRVVNNNTGSVSQSLRDEAELNTEVRIQI